MPFLRPTLQQLKDRAAARLAAELKLGAIPRKGPLRALANLDAASSHLEHGHIADGIDQLLPDLATGEELERWAAIKGLSRKPPGPASGVVHFTGSGTTLIPAGTVVARSDGISYATIADANIASGIADVSVQAVVGGLNGDCDIGTILQLSTFISGIDSAPTVIDDGNGNGIIDGTDEETDDELRARLLELLRAAPVGGSLLDWVRYTKQVPGVTRAWARSDWATLPGNVGIAFAIDDDPSGPVPGGGKVAEVQAYLLDIARRPAGSTPVVFAFTPHPLNVHVTISPNTAAVQAAINQSILELCLREGDLGATMLFAHLTEAIALSDGLNNFNITAPSADVTLLSYEIVTPGTTVFS